MKRGKKELLTVFFVITLVILILLGVLIADNSESISEWWSAGKYLNNTRYDGTPYTIISGLNYSTFQLSSFGVYDAPAIAYSSVYIGSPEGIFYRLNASNISQMIDNFTTVGVGQGDASIRGSPAVVNGWVYFGGGSPSSIYQLNATNFSQNFTSSYGSGQTGPVIATAPGMGLSLYSSSSAAFYQLNASNISQKIGNFTVGDGATGIMLTAAYANDYIYIGGYPGGGGSNTSFYQLNATNISLGYIRNYSSPLQGSTGMMGSSSILIWNNYTYFGSDQDPALYQLNASNVSQKFANYTPGGGGVINNPAIATIGGNTYVYFGKTASDSTFYQLNATNISKRIAKYSINLTGDQFYTVGAPVIANGYAYFGAGDGYIYQLNASNVSNLVGRVYISSVMTFPPAYAGGYLYIGATNGVVYQLNATNLSLLTVVDQIPPGVIIDFPWSFTTYAGTAPVGITLNEYGYCFYSTNGGQTNRSLVTNDNLNFRGDTAALADGTYVLNVYCNDTTGNRNDTTTITFVMNSSQGNHVSGGGGGELPPNPSPQKSTWDMITPNKPVVVTSSDARIGIVNISIATTVNVSSASLVMQQIPNSNLTSADFRIGTRGVIYQAFSINVVNLNSSNLATVIIGFRVNKTWAQQNVSNPNRIYLYRKPTNSTTWSRLLTTQTGADSDYYYYSAISPGFSTFLVFFDAGDCVPTSIQCTNNEVQSCADNSTWVVKQKCVFGCSDGNCAEQNIFPNAYYIAGVVLFLGVIIFVYLRIRKKGKK